MSYWASTVPRVKDGETTFSANSLNPIIDALVNRTEYLYNLSGDRGYLMPDVGFSDECKKGTLVAKDPGVDGKYIPATAVWAGTRPDGSLAPSYKANVIGVLINNPADNGGVGTILCEGWTSDTELINALAPNRVSGDYYLTAAEDTRGKATCDNVSDLPLRAYCYTYISTGKLYINPGRPEYAGHAHSSVEINQGWLPVADITLGSTELPANASYAINTTSNDALRDLIETNPQKPCLVRNGVEVPGTMWGIVDSFIYLTFTPESSDVFTLHAITPLLANESIIRQVKATSNNKLITVQNVGGKVWLGINKSDDTTHYSGVGVTALDNNGVRLGPVVQGIRAGAGAMITKHFDADGREIPGVVEVSVSQYKNTLIDMNLCNLNSVLIGTSFYGVSYVFPQGSRSSLTGTIRVPHFSGTSVKGEFVLVYQGNGSSITGITLTSAIQNLPTPGGSVPMGLMVSYDADISLASPDNNRCYCQVIPVDAVPDVMRNLSDSLIICTLESAGVVPITLISMSFRLV